MRYKYEDVLVGKGKRYHAGRSSGPNDSSTYSVRIGVGRQGSVVWPLCFVAPVSVGVLLIKPDTVSHQAQKLAWWLLHDCV